MIYINHNKTGKKKTSRKITEDRPCKNKYLATWPILIDFFNDNLNLMEENEAIIHSLNK